MDHSLDTQTSLNTAKQVLLQALSDGQVIDTAVIEQAAAAVHAAWVDRHPHPENLKDLQPYSELPESEKEKDRVIVRRAMTELGTI